MKGMLCVLTAYVVCSLAACGGDDKVKIVLFQAAPDTINAGESTRLFFAVDPPDAKVSISGLGDLTGQTSASVTPTATTSYTLTATSGGATADQTAKVTVNIAPLRLVYSPPTSGRVRLVANEAQSTAQAIQLDLVATERLELSTFFGGGPGSFAVGMNLPLDTTRVTGDDPMFAAGNALALQDSPPVAAARIGDDHVLYTVVTRKRVTGPDVSNFTQSIEVQPGQVFYSVRLKLADKATRGSVFDGTQPGPLYRAAVRDQWGDDFVGQSDIGVGALEVR